MGIIMICNIYIEMEATSVHMYMTWYVINARVSMPSMPFSVNYARSCMTDIYRSQECSLVNDTQWYSFIEATHNNLLESVNSHDGIFDIVGTTDIILLDLWDLKLIIDVHMLISLNYAWNKIGYIQINMFIN